MAPEFIKDFFSKQKNIWEEVDQNYNLLENCEKRIISGFPYPLYLQFNPARIKSTKADISEKAINERKCFLCRDNRDSRQITITLFEGFDTLVNPYPIFPIHLTISSIAHKPQEINIEEMIEMSKSLAGMVIFFNGAKAGASAPDHLHYQAVLNTELPLVEYIQQNIYTQNKIINSKELDQKFPFNFYTGILGQRNEISSSILSNIKNIGGGQDDNDRTLLNTFIWMDKQELIRFLIIPRAAHRPRCYYDSGENQILISPGCIDMAGVIITPRKEDFEKVSLKEIKKIYNETGKPN